MGRMCMKCGAWDGICSDGHCTVCGHIETSDDRRRFKEGCERADRKMMEDAEDSRRWAEEEKKTWDAWH